MAVSAPWDLLLRGNIGETQVKHFLVDCLGFLGIKLPVRFRVLRIKHSDETMKIKRIYGTGRTQTIQNPCAETQRNERFTHRPVSEQAVEGIGAPDTNPAIGITIGCKPSIL